MVVPLYEQARQDAGRLRAARWFALAAHSAVGQLRKYTLEPYIVHPDEVAEIVATVPHITEMLEASKQQNKNKETKETEQNKHKSKGPIVAHYVSGLTNFAKPADGNRQRRFEINCLHLKAQCAEVQPIKVADLISYTSTIVEYDPKFAKVYLEEKRQMLDMLTKANPDLIRRARSILKESFYKLEKTA